MCFSDDGFESYDLPWLASASSMLGARLRVASLLGDKVEDDDDDLSEGIGIDTAAVFPGRPCPAAPWAIAGASKESRRRRGSVNIVCSLLSLMKRTPNCREPFDVEIGGKS